MRLPHICSVGHCLRPGEAAIERRTVPFGLILLTFFAANARHLPLVVVTGSRANKKHAIGSDVRADGGILVGTEIGVQLIPGY
jgi:hypothetical protein